MPSNAIIIEETGPDWEPTINTRFYAQRGLGKFAFGATEAEALANLLAAEAPEVETITEACGAVWEARKTEVALTNPNRAYWVHKIDGPASVAQPGIVGFYIQSIDAALRALQN